MRSALGSALFLAGCAGSPCVDASAACDPLYEPTFDNLYTRTFQPTCALDGGCHSDDNPSKGLSMAEIDQAYEGLIARIDGDELGCHTLILRIDSDEDTVVMPPGDPMPEAERCAIRQWVDAGAPR